MKCLVTGGAGFVGSNLVDRLIRDGHEVVVIDDLSTGLRDHLNPSAKFYNGGVENKNLVDTLFAMELPEIVFHCAALARIQPSFTVPLSYQTSNVEGTAVLLEACKRYKVRRVVFSSSSSIYGDQDEPLLHEGMTPNMKSVYSATKRMGEIYCALYAQHLGVDTVSLRYFNVYGPRQIDDGPYATVLGIWLRQHKAGEPLSIVGDGTQSRDFTHVDDVVEANVLAANTQQSLGGMILNIGTGESWKLKDLATMIDPSQGFDFVSERPGEYKATRADNREAGRVLGWIPKVKVDAWLKSQL